MLSGKEVRVTVRKDVQLWRGQSCTLPVEPWPAFL